TLEDQKLIYKLDLFVVDQVLEKLKIQAQRDFLPYPHPSTSPVPTLTPATLSRKSDAVSMTAASGVTKSTSRSPKASSEATLTS
ncbi:MAG: hypothetical protein J6W39_05810, partial [Spirochaetales bacterium]|nr:hypothetical protein [Spirochaetales bacterium]